MSSLFSFSFFTRISRSLPKRLVQIPATLVAQHLTSRLLSRFVLLEESAREHMVPILLMPQESSESATLFFIPRCACIVTCGVRRQAGLSCCAFRLPVIYFFRGRLPAYFIHLLFLSRADRPQYMSTTSPWGMRVHTLNFSSYRSTFFFICRLAPWLLVKMLSCNVHSESILHGVETVFLAYLNSLSIL